MDLNKKRGIVRGQLTRIENYIRNNNDCSESELIARFESLASIFEKFNSVQDAIEVKDENGTEEEAIRQEFEDKYFAVQAMYRDKINFIKKVSPNSTSGLEFQANTQSRNEMSNRLPVIKLPSFSGIVGEWQTFKDTFLSLIHNEQSLDNVRKFHYLKTCLTGEAAKLVNSILVNSDNYLIAWGLLVKRFDNKKILINHYMGCLFSQGKIKNENLNEIRSLIDNTTRYAEALKALELPVEHWDAVLVFTITSRLDPETKKQWDLSLKDDEVPKFSELLDFLQKHCYALSNSQNIVTGNKSGKSASCHALESDGRINSNYPPCSICGWSHRTFQCESLLSLSPRKRYELVKQKGLCLKCLRPDHQLSKCTFFNCKKYKGLHNNLLHFDEDKSEKTSELVSNLSVNHSQVLLTTAMVRISSLNGVAGLARALLDSGSQSNFISQRMVKRMQLKTKKANCNITCVGRANKSVSLMTDCVLSSPIHSFKKTITCLVVPEITTRLPNSRIQSDEWKFLENYSLADPMYGVPALVDLLIGADTFDEICLGDLIVTSNNCPNLRSTVFGWVLSGKVGTTFSGLVSNVVCTSKMENDFEIHRFWEIEEISPKVEPEDQTCENHFVKNCVRLDSCRFRVTMPLKSENALCSLGDSLQIAKTRFRQLENRFSKNPQLKMEYSKFIKEYIELGHMRLVNDCSYLPSTTYYLPHHPVFKESSSSTKLRVVFNGSQGTTSGLSLNDVLLCGPTIQDDLFSILTRFRCYKYVIGADIVKMYRQISVNPDQTQLLRILWRENENDEMSHYELTTVTYGTKCASFLATRCIKQLSLDFCKKYPRASVVLSDDCYVDNVLTGAQTIDEALVLRNDLISITDSGCFPLRKWCSNERKIVEDLPESWLEVLSGFCFDKDCLVNTLGLTWDCVDDKFVFKFNFDSRKSTKRIILSQISRVFDPLGLLAPVIVKAKNLIQLMWTKGSDWDDDLDPDIYSKWLSFSNDLNEAGACTVDRLIFGGYDGPVFVHAFCDASKIAYSCCLYLVTNDISNLMCAKTKVSPLKTVSVARLELCGALLLSKLVQKVISSLKNIKVEHIYMWCDSQITLHWIRSPPYRWKCFVANRVSLIQELLKEIPHSWRYVPSHENPADVASRGCNIRALLDDRLWWKGPEWISLNAKFWPRQPQFIDIEKSEDNEINTFCHFNALSCEYFPERYSSLSRLVSVVVVMFRFINLCRKGEVVEFVRSSEYLKAMKSLVYLHQSRCFLDDRKRLESGKTLLPSSGLVSLNAFLDADGLLRVGGRLKNAQITYDRKHPYLLHYDDHLTSLIIDYTHRKHYHAGPQLLKTILRQQFWVLRANTSIKKVLNKCVACRKLKCSRVTQLMGDLPLARVTACRPFQRCGIDNAGPFNIKRFSGRCNKIEKAYVCLFVCFVTRAIHLELVSDLSTEAFIACLRRFIARRGRPSDIFCDNGRNFVGAKSTFDKFKHLLSLKSSQDQISDFSRAEFIEWHFIPAYSPHMGGLWEAGVKSLKTHLNSTVNVENLTFEELYTVLVEIEMCLNSRPLTELSSDPLDLEPLTPSHFLIATFPETIPERNPSLRDCLLSRWNKLRNLRNIFWKRWSGEFLSRLQIRSKWKIAKDNLKIGELVIIKQPNLPPIKWNMGRVVDVKSGSDGLNRVVVLKTKDGLTNRSVFDLCRLPVAFEQSAQPGEHVR